MNKLRQLIVIVLGLVLLGVVSTAKSYNNTTQVDLKQKTYELLQDKESFLETLRAIKNVPINPEKIVGGSQASRNQFRDFAMILIYDSNNQLENFCGGTLIANNKVLTVAHCTVDMILSKVIVIPNFYTFNDSPSNLSLFQLSAIRKHPNFSNNSPYNDIAVLTLLGNANNANGAQVIPVYAGNMSLTGFSSTIIGLGQTSADSEATLTLRRANVPIIDNNFCETSQTGLIGPIRASQLCAGYATGGVGTCFGDSGGPIYTTVNNKRVQAGITSYGIPCAQANAYDLYTRVSSFYQFIKGNSPNTEFVFDDPNLIGTGTFNLTPIMMLLLDE